MCVCVSQRSISVIFLYGSLSFFFNLKFVFIYFYVYKHFAYICACAPCACLVPSEARRGHWIPCYHSYRWLWATASMWVLGVEPESSGGAVSTLKHWTVSLSPPFLSFFSFLETGSLTEPMFQLGLPGSTCLCSPRTGFTEVPLCPAFLWAFMFELRSYFTHRVTSPVPSGSFSANC